MIQAQSSTSDNAYNDFMLCLRFGEKCSKLGRFKKGKIFFCSLKRTSLERLSLSVNELLFMMTLLIIINT
jgi:hypothetical protein